VLARSVVATALLMSTLPLCAGAAEAPAPIVVSETITHNDNLDQFNHNRGPNNVIVTFKNVASQTVKDVMFVVFDENGIVRGRIQDKGTFSPGTTIKHVFDNCYDGLGPLMATFVPIAATFADGSAWHGPDAYAFSKLSCSST
jgi:hypothetical protein